MMNRGAEKLRERLQKRGEKKRFAGWLSSKLQGSKVDPPMVSHWLNGERKPTPQQRALIEDEYGIGWRTWDEDGVPKQGAA